MKSGQISVRGNAEVQISPFHKRIQVFQRIFIDIGKDLPEELFQELQMGCKASCRTSAALTCFIIVKRGNDVERIEAPVLCISYVDDTSAEVVSQLGILILRVKNEYLCILGGEVQKK